MFVPSQEPIALSEACLLGLRPSLNAPVVRNDELSSSPARAAIVTFAEEYGDLGMAVAIRALESGQVVVYRCRESLADDADVSHTMDAALSFAEGLGFLFDDDIIERESGAGRSEALEHWNRLTGDGEVFTASGVAPPPAPPLAAITSAGEGPEVPIEDLMAPDHAVAVADPVADVEGSLLLDELMEVVEERPRLSKLRGAAARAGPAASEPLAEPTEPDLGDPIPERPAAAADPASGPAALGRIPIVRRRREAEGGRASLLARILASF